MIIARRDDPVAAISQHDQDYWRRLGGRIVRLADIEDDADTVVDLDGQYGRLMDEYACDVIVKRPDYYIFGACPGVQDLPALLSDLRTQLESPARQPN